MTTHGWTIALVRNPSGLPSADDFSLERRSVPEAESGEVVLRTIYLSLDPYMRTRISQELSYAPALRPGDVMIGEGIAEVVTSRHPDFAPGDLVLAPTGWRSHHVMRADRQIRHLDPRHRPMTTALGPLGMPGLTAYAGLFAIGRPQPDETVAVAAATGPVGSLVGQFAAISGARTIGIAGGTTKRGRLGELGFDVALDHTAGGLSEQLANVAPDGIDVYFENVGGAVWEAIVPRLSYGARVPVCGFSAYYNVPDPTAGPNLVPTLMRDLATRGITLRGFTFVEFMRSHREAFLEKVSGWLHEGRITYDEQIVNGLPNAPQAFVDLMSGRHLGKVLVRVGEEPR